MFEPTIVEGVAACLEDPEKMMIPQSMARRMFGNESAIGKSVRVKDKIPYWDEPNFIVGAAVSYTPLQYHRQRRHGVRA